MRKLFIPLIASLLFFSNLASANDSVYVIGEPQADLILITCDTEKDNIAFAIALSESLIIAYGNIMILSKQFHCSLLQTNDRSLISFVVNNFTCKVYRQSTLDNITVITAGKAIIVGSDSETFNIFFTESDAPNCE